MKINTLQLTTAMALGTLSLSVSADPWTSFPGTKARGMGTAFTAIANDPSAAWYNPAGLYQMDGSNFSLEYSNAPSFEGGIGVNLDDSNSASSWDSMAADNDSLFASYNTGDGEDFGFSFYFYQPYYIEAPASRTLGNDFVGGFIKESVSVIGMGYSQNLFSSDGRFFSDFHVGFTAEWVEVDIDDTEIEINGALEDLDSLDVESGLAGSIGFLTTLYKGERGKQWSPTWKLGGVFRLSGTSIMGDSSDDFTIGGTTIQTQDFFNTKPQSWNMGLSMNMPIHLSTSGVWSVELASDFGSTAFDSILTDVDYDKLAFGGAIKWARPAGVFRQVELRFGMYDQEANSDLNDVIEVVNVDLGIEAGQIYPEVSGITFGLQVTLFEDLALEVATERREMDNALRCNLDANNFCLNDQLTVDLSETLTTAAVRYRF